MNAAPPAKRTPLETLWLAVRFVVFGVVGFLVMFLGWMSLIIKIDDPHEQQLLKPIIAGPLVVIGPLMMLYGAGQWRRWAYLWVFLSTPITISILFLGSQLVLRWFPNTNLPDFIDPKLMGILAFGAPMPITYVLAKGYYRRKDAHAAE